MIGKLRTPSPAFVIACIVSSLEGIDAQLELAALTLGASRPRALWEVVVPLVAPGLLSALLFAFMHGVDLRSVTAIDVQDRAAIVAAFRHVFVAIAFYAAVGAWVASRVPRVRF